MKSNGLLVTKVKHPYQQSWNED